MKRRLTPEQKRQLEAVPAALPLRELVGHVLDRLDPNRELQQAHVMVELPSDASPSEAQHRIRGQGGLAGGGRRAVGRQLAAVPGAAAGAPEPGDHHRWANQRRADLCGPPARPGLPRPKHARSASPQSAEIRGKTIASLCTVLGEGLTICAARRLLPCLVVDTTSALSTPDVTTCPNRPLRASRCCKLRQAPSAAETME